ncbi:hypothetical protein HDU81_008475 [Chytriomyces hyalinus]|nr:hypothetical protein HDU81_008475 [Chytriomyces hyalinus]
MVTILDALPKCLQVNVDTASPLNDIDYFFDTMSRAKKDIVKLSLGNEYLKCCDSESATLNMTTKWLAKLSIHELHFPRSYLIPTQIRGMLHLVPKLSSLHLQTLEDSAGIDLSECKALWHISISKLFVGAEGPEVLVQQLLDILKGTKIVQLEVFLPRHVKNFLPSDLRDLVAALFLQHGWHEQPTRVLKKEFGDYVVYRRQR